MPFLGLGRLSPFEPTAHGVLLREWLFDLIILNLFEVLLNPLLNGNCFFFFTGRLWHGIARKSVLVKVLDRSDIRPITNSQDRPWKLPIKSDILIQIGATHNKSEVIRNRMSYIEIQIEDLFGICKLQKCGCLSLLMRITEICKGP